MSVGLELRVERVRDQACRQASRLGIARGLTIVLVAWVALGTLDVGFRLADPGLRWMLSLAAWGSLLGARVWTYRWSRWARQLDPVYVARRIEQVFPQLRDRLACSYEFLRTPAHTSATRESSELRRAAVAETAALAAGLDLEQALDARRLRPSLLALAVVGLLTAALFTFAPATTTLAARRLAMPWRDLPWPRVHRLEWVEFPYRVAAGGEVTLQIRDERGKVPEGVELSYRFDDESPDRIERTPMRLRDDRFVYRFEQLTRSMLVRAEGGDDFSMPWQLIEVDEPPRLDRCDVWLVPPEYTGRKPERAGQPLRALAGSRVDIQGRANRVLAAVRIRSVDSDRGVQATARLNRDETGFSFAGDPESSWVLQKSGVFALELTDQSGLSGEAQRFVVQVLPDDPPTISWERPEADAAVTAQGEVPVAVLAKDDLAVRQVTLRYRVHEPTGPRRGRLGEGAQTYDEVPLYAGPRKLAPAADMMGDMAGDSRMVEFNWDLGTIDRLEPDAQLELWIAVEDYKGQVVEAAPRRLQVISAADYDDRVGQREALLLHLLGESLQQQQETRQQMAALETLLREQGRLEPRNLDQLQAVELQQRQVSRILGTGRDGARGLIAALLDDIRHNRVKNSALVSRLDSLSRELAALEQEHLAFISPALIAVRKSAPVDSTTERWPSAPALTAGLTTAVQHADAAVQRLEHLLRELSPWDELRRTLREFARLARDQEEIQRQTTVLLQDTDAEAAPEQATRRDADRIRLSERQFELERRLARLTARLELLQKNLAADGAHAALAATVAATRESPAGSRMREAGQQLNENRLGQALLLEGEALAELHRLLDLLSGRSSAQAAPPSLPRVEVEVQQVLQRQRKVRQELEPLAAARKSSPATIEPEELKRLAELAGLERDLARTTRQLADDVQADAEGVALVLRGTAAQTERLAIQLGPPGDLVAAQATLEAVIRRLELLQDALRPDENSTESPPAKPPEGDPREGPTAPASPRARGLAELKLLQSLQLEIHRRTGELEAARRRQGSLTPELATELRELASEQGRLAELVGKLLETTGDDARP